MWHAVELYRGDYELQYSSLSGGTVDDFASDHQTASRLWKAWILTERVRRTQVAVDTICNLYETMRGDWLQGTGILMLTARRGLWSAESSVDWFRVSQTKAPLQISPIQPERLISECAAEEIDDFVKLGWTLLLGKDRVQWWVDNGRSRPDSALTSVGPLQEL